MSLCACYVDLATHKTRVMAVNSLGKHANMSFILSLHTAEQKTSQTVTEEFSFPAEDFVFLSDAELLEHEKLSEQAGRPSRNEDCKA